jgi:formate dehydrogenase subunit beta
MSRTIEVKDGQPLNTTRKLLQDIWETACLEALLVPVWSDEYQLPLPTVIRDPEALAGADPFAPVMPVNAAAQALEAMRTKQSGVLGIYLRPCELRSLRKMAKAGDALYNDVLLISSDCLGALPSEDFHQHLTLVKDHSVMTRDTLHFAAQGGILPSRCQQSCQLCEAPYPDDSDVILHLFGYETQRQLALGWHAEKFKTPLENKLALSEADPGAGARRERVLAKLARWRNKSFESRQDNLDPSHITPGAFLDHLEHCSSCWDALETQCPTFNLPGQQLGDEQDLINWLSTCSGCGMCDNDCPDDYPLFEAVLSLRQAIAGASPAPLNTH